jgi:hypothetical protein
MVFQYGAPVHGAQYGAPAHGAPQYGAPQYGPPRPQYGPQYGPPQYSPPPHPPFHPPHLAPYAGGGNPQVPVWGYGHYPPPPPEPPRRDAIDHAERALHKDWGRTAAGARAVSRGVDNDERVKPAVVQPKKTLNNEVSKGGMSYSASGMLTADVTSLGVYCQGVTNCDAWTVFSFPLPLFIVCTITVGHVTDDFYFRT